MSCFESSKFLRNPQVLNQDVLKQSCDNLGWKYEIRNGDLVVTDANLSQDLHGEYLLKVSGSKVSYNTYYISDAGKYASQLQEQFYELNISYSKETILREFERAGFAFKRDYDFVPNEEEVDSFFMVGYSKLENEDEKRTEIRFTILSDGAVVSDSNYIPEDIHKLADEAMSRIDAAFGTERKEGVHIKRKEIPERYKTKAYCTVNNKIKAKN